MSYRKRAAPAPSVVVAVAAPDEEVVEFKHFKKRTPVVPPPASQPAVVLVVEEEEQVQLFYSLDACKEEALKYHTKNEFEKKCPDAFAVAKRNEWLDEVCAHMKPAEKLLSWGHWNLENCKKEALKFETRIAFYRASGSAYNSASRHGWIEEVCAHMKPSNKLVKKGHWNLDNCKLEAMKFTGRKEFYKKSGSAYNSASRHGWLDEVCAHMPSSDKKVNLAVNNTAKVILK